MVVPRGDFDGLLHAGVCQIWLNYEILRLRRSALFKLPRWMLTAVSTATAMYQVCSAYEYEYVYLAPVGFVSINSVWITSAVSCSPSTGARSLPCVRS